MIILKDENVKIIKDHVDVMKKMVNMLENYGVIKKLRAEIFYTCLKDIDVLMNGGNLDSTLPGNVGEGESNSPKEESGLHDGPESESV